MTKKGNGKLLPRVKKGGPATGKVTTTTTATTGDEGTLVTTCSQVALKDAMAHVPGNRDKFQHTTIREVDVKKDISDEDSKHQHSKEREQTRAMQRGFQRYLRDIRNFDVTYEEFGRPGYGPWREWGVPYLR